MRYSYDVCVPKDTTIEEPYEYRLRLDYGTLKQVIVRWRAGCHNRVFVAIYDGLLQIVPAAGTYALYADNLTMAIPMDWPIYSAPFELTGKFWSPGTLFEHTISIWLDLEEQVESERVSIVEQMKHLLGL